MSNTLDKQELKELTKISSQLIRINNLDEICQTTAEEIVEHSIFARCVVSILEYDGSFARKGFGGLSPEEIEKVCALPKSTLADKENQLQERFKISRSYYIPHDQLQLEGLKSKKKAGNGTWHPDDFLFIPLYDPDDQIVGIISVDEPKDNEAPTEETLLPLELFATQIAAVLQNLKNRDKLHETIQQLRDQQDVVLELSTPVIKVWEQIIVLPLIGSVDSERAQQIMENVLTKISETEATVIIIDITGVPIIDTLVASHLIKTVAAARLLGAGAIITGINPEIAQTLVHLGVDLSNIITKSDLARGIEEALRLTGKGIGPIELFNHED